MLHSLIFSFSVLYTSLTSKMSTKHGQELLARCFYRRWALQDLINSQDLAKFQLAQNTLPIITINFEGFLDIQLCQIQVDKFTVGLRPSLQGLNTRAPKFQNLDARAHGQFQCLQIKRTLQGTNHKLLYAIPLCRVSLLLFILLASACTPRSWACNWSSVL